MGYIKGEDGVEGVTKGTYLRYDVYTWGADLQPQAAYNELCQHSSLKPLLYSPQHPIASPGATLTRPSNGDYRT